MPHGAFYAFPNIEGTGMTSLQFANDLLTEAGVACLDGESFGVYGTGYVRFSFANSVEKIEKALKESKEQFGLKENQVKKNVDALIKVYSTMKPAEAANLIAAIDQHLALQIISGMKSKIAGQVLSQLEVKVAKAITEKLAGKIKDSKK